METPSPRRAEISLGENGSKLGMWLFLMTEILLFGGMFLLYAAYRAKYSGEFHGAAASLNTFVGAANTLILLTSSLTMALSIAAIRRERKVRSLALQISTIVLAFVFLANKVLEWGEKIRHGIYPGSHDLLSLDRGELLFYNLYYVMTGLHGFHVVAGIVLISFMSWFTASGTIHAGNHVRLENSGLYWHLVDIIWIYLFPLFYLIT